MCNRFGCTACDTVPPDLRAGRSRTRRYPLSLLLKMETMMRTLILEELELVAGGLPGGVPASKQNNGLGNGDQTAPGASLEVNGAENNTGETSGNPPGSGNFPVVPN